MLQAIILLKDLSFTSCNESSLFRNELYVQLTFDYGTCFVTKLEVFFISVAVSKIKQTFMDVVLSYHLQTKVDNFGTNILPMTKK